MADTGTGQGPEEQLAHLLRELRAARTPRTSQALAADLAGPGFSQSKIARIESGALAPTPMDAGRLATALGAARVDARRAIRLALDVREARAGLAPVRTVFTQRPGLGQRQWRHRERDAHTVTTFQPAVVPGLLQTEEYMRAVYRSSLTADPAGEDEFVRERTERQSARAHLPAVQIFTAGALHGGAMPLEVRLAQCAHIAELTRTHRQWEIGVVPDDAPGYAFPVSGFDLYDYDRDSAHVVVGTEIGPGRTTVAGAVRTVREKLAALRALAVFGDDARTELARIAERIRCARE